MGDALFDMWPIVWKSVQKGFLTDAALPCYRSPIPKLILLIVSLPPQAFDTLFLTLHIRMSKLDR